MLPSLSLSSSTNSATIRVDKATSEFLMAPDWTMNMEICDSVNSDHGMAKDVTKAVKKRLQHKNPRVQMLTLTLLETLVKNCGENIHFHIAEKKVLDEMIKIVKKRTDLQVRGKILVLLDSWQEAFGGPGGRHGQYYWAYDELRRSGVEFPQRSLDTVPIITPRATNPPAILGMPSNSPRTLDEAMASEGLSVSEMETIRNAMELLADMLQAVNPNDRMSVKDEVIVDLVERCRTNQKRLVQMLGTTLDEELLGQGLELNDVLQALLTKHDAIASGSPLPAHLTSTASSRPNESSTSNLNLSDSRPEESSSCMNTKPPIPSGDTMKGCAVEEDEEEDEFALLAKRHSRASPVAAKSEDFASESTISNALVPVDPPSPAKITKDQDMVDFLSIVLSTSFTPEEEPIPQAPQQDYTANNVQPSFSSYVVPWAQTQPEHQSQPQNHQQMQFSPQQTSSVQPSAYPPPPWAPTPGFSTGQTMMTPQHTNSVPQEAKHVSTPIQGFQNPNIANQLAISSVQPTVNTSPTTIGGQPTALSSAKGGQKPYVPSYRLFEDLNVFGNVEGGKMRSGAYSSSSTGSSSQSVVGGRR